MPSPGQAPSAPQPQSSLRAAEKGSTSQPLGNAHNKRPRDDTGSHGGESARALRRDKKPTAKTEAHEQHRKHPQQHTTQRSPATHAHGSSAGASVKQQRWVNAASPTHAGARRAVPGGAAPRAAERARLPSPSTPSALPSSPAPSSRLYHPFKANFNDHFETSSEALRDVLPFINELRQLLRPSTPERLTLYDPYYCSGAVVTAWKALGVEHVLHDNRDFYEDVAAGTVPGPYDVLVTNPPFSDDHIWRLLCFLATQSPLKPWAFVAPDYIAAKPQYREWIRRYFTPAPPPPPTVRRPGEPKDTSGAAQAAKRTLAAAAAARIPSIASMLPPFLLPPETEDENGQGAPGEGDTSGDGPQSSAKAGAAATSPSSNSTSGPIGPEPFYIIPRVRYDYQHPLGVGHEHSHFKSMWYVWAGRHTSEVLRAVTVALAGRGRATGAGGGGASPAPGAASVVSVVHGLDALVHGQHVTATERRPSPQQRQRGGHVHHGGRGRGGRR